MFVLLFIALSASQFIVFTSLFFTFTVMFCSLFSIHRLYSVYHAAKLKNIGFVSCNCGFVACCINFGDFHVRCYPCFFCISIFRTVLCSVIRFVPVPVHILFSGSHATPVFLFLRITVSLPCSESSDWSGRCNAGFRLFYP